MPNSTRSDSPAAHWHTALIRDLVAVSPALVYDPVAGGDTSAAPLLRELRLIHQQITAARTLQNTIGDPLATRKRRRLPGSARPQRSLTPLTAAASFDPARTLARLREIAAAARGAIRTLERNRRYRDVPTVRGAPTLYQAYDLPRGIAWRQALKGAQILAARLRELPALPVAPPKHAGKPTGHMRTELPLSALYERWVYLRLLRAFQHGVAGIPGATAPEPTWFDLESAELDGAVFQVNGRTIRLRFEPWILSRELAIAGGHALYRAGLATHAWRPDVLIQVEDGVRAGIPIVRDLYVIDGKLASSVRTHLWDQVAKYRFIRASINDARVVRSILLALPGVQPEPAQVLHEQLDAPEVDARVLALLPGDPSHAGEESLQRLVTEVLARTAR